MLKRGTNESIAGGEDAGSSQLAYHDHLGSNCSHFGKVKMPAHLCIYLRFSYSYDPHGPVSIYNQAEILSPRSYTRELDRNKIWVQSLSPLSHLNYISGSNRWAHISTWRSWEFGYSLVHVWLILLDQLSLLQRMALIQLVELSLNGLLSSIGITFNRDKALVSNFYIKLDIRGVGGIATMPLIGRIKFLYY